MKGTVNFNFSYLTRGFEIKSNQIKYMAINNRGKIDNYNLQQYIEVYGFI